MWQAHHVASLLRGVVPGREVVLVEVLTIGDRDRSEPLSQMGGMGVFTREVQAVVLDGRADLAVHSLKDLPTESIAGLSLAGVPERGPRFDVLVLPTSDSSRITSLDEIPEGARVGTGSLRRQAQLLHTRPDLAMTEIRGNVETRLRKLDEGEYDVIVLAAAGLERLELADRVSLIMRPPLMFPAVGQAALGIECRTDDVQTRAVLEQITDARTLAEVTAERACLRELRAGCHAPVGVLTEFRDDNQLRLTAVVLSGDGRERIVGNELMRQDAAEDLGREVASRLIASGADRLLSIQNHPGDHP